jgi:hypothetical protein
MSKFTPGPWQTNGSHIYGPDPERELVAQAHGDGEGAWSTIGGSRMCANRDLIAAAPDMYEALKTLERLFSLWNLDYEEDSALEVARAALAKAKGKPTQSPAPDQPATRQEPS